MFLLILAWAVGGFVTNAKFKFHYVSINSTPENFIVTDESKFKFHYVSINSVLCF